MLQLYVKKAEIANEHDTKDLIAKVKKGQMQINASLDELFLKLKDIGIEV